MRSWYLLLMLVLVSTGAMAQKYYENFDKSQLGTPRPWRLEGHEDSPSAMLSTNQSISGSKSFRAYLPRKVYSNARSEIRFEGENGVPKHQTIRQTWGASFAIYVPGNFKPDYNSREMIMQYHGLPDPEDTYKSPAFAIYVDGTKFTTRLRYYTGSPSTPSNQVDKSFDIGTLTPGKWHHFVVDIHWDYRQNGNGSAKIYMRKGAKPTSSDQKVNYRGPIGSNDDKGPYFKLGVYKWDWKKSAKVDEARKAGIDNRMYYFDNVTIQKGAIIGGGSSNSNPTVSISGSSSLTLPSNSTTLTANASDSDGSVASYSWSKVSGPSVSMSGKSSSKLSLSNMVAGTYKFQVRVTDNDGASATSTKTVNVYSGTSGGGGSTGGVSAGEDFAIDVAERNFDLVATWDNSINMKSVKWTKISGPNCKIEEKGSKIHVHWIHVGTLVFEVRLTDSNNKVYTDRINVTVTDGPPQEGDSGSGGGTGTLSVDAGNDLVVPWADRNFDLAATWNSNINVTYVKWTKLSGPNCKIEEKGSKIHVHWISAGNYEFEVEIRNGKGEVGKDRVKVRVTETSSSMASFSDEFPGIPVRNYVTKEDTISLMNAEEEGLKVFLRNTNGTKVSIGQFSGELNVETLRTGLYQYDVVEEGGDVIQQGTILIY